MQQKEEEIRQWFIYGLKSSKKRAQLIGHERLSQFGRKGGLARWKNGNKDFQIQK
jgi:hypothetical protein